MLHYRAVVFIFLIHCVPGEVVERCPRFLFVYTFTAIRVPKNLISGTFIPPCSLLVWVALLINVTSKPQAAHYRRPRSARANKRCSFIRPSSALSIYRRLLPLFVRPLYHRRPMPSLRVCAAYSAQRNASKRQAIAGRAGGQLRETRRKIRFFSL